MLGTQLFARPGLLALAVAPILGGVGLFYWSSNSSPRSALADTGPGAGKLQLPEPADGKMYNRAELEQHFPELMDDFNRLARHIPMDWDGLPDFKALADRMPAELVRLAGELSRKSREQFRALIHLRVRTLNALERAFGGEEIAGKLLTALDAADANGATPM